MKRVLVISPFFPPVNGADMQRARMSLSYFREFDWEPEVIAVETSYTDYSVDNLLLESIPTDVKINHLKAFSKQLTNKFGLGSLALRSLWFYRQKVNSLLMTDKYDLIYFSTTQFPLCVLGAYWKRRFGVPYVIDFQDPWHSDYYQDKPKSQRPPKYWFSYRLNKYLEPRAIKSVDGLISVSEAYIDALKARYPVIRGIPAVTIPFGFYEPDLAIAQANQSSFSKLLSADTKNVVYIGRGGADMRKSIAALFEQLRATVTKDTAAYQNLRFYFIGTSYAPAGQGQYTILPLAKQFGVEKYVTEITDRISFYHTLVTLQQAHALFIPGSDDPKYTASKLYPYLLTRKPLLAIFNSMSPALDTLRKCGVADAYGYDDSLIGEYIDHFLDKLISNSLAAPNYNQDEINVYSAENMTRRQCALFDQVIALRSTPPTN